MNMLALAINAFERAPLRDGVTLAGVNYLCRRTKRRLAAAPIDVERSFMMDMQRRPIAMHADAANHQHYEVTADFFRLVLGPRWKYSCCLYPDASTSLDQAEAAALAETVTNAGIENGMDILELGCGWGSLSLYLAQQFPDSSITSVSNSRSQRLHISAAAAAMNLRNLTVVNADMNDFSAERRYDRILSVEMFEHMSNWETLLQRAGSWLKSDGRLFLHIFTHKDRSYRFDHEDPADWIAQHFFTGGIMPARDMPHRFPDLFRVEQEWRWSGKHYQRTALDWLSNFDDNVSAIRPVLASVYNDEAALWERRWRLFFLATAGLFGHDAGDIWGVGHYLMAPAR